MLVLLLRHLRVYLIKCKYYVYIYYFKLRKVQNIMTAPPVDIVTPTQKQTTKHQVFVLKNVRLTSAESVGHRCYNVSEAHTSADI